MRTLTLQDLDFDAIFEEAFRDIKSKKPKAKSKPKHCRICDATGHYANTCDVAKAIRAASSHEIASSSSRRKTYVKITGHESIEFLRSKLFKTPSKDNLIIAEGSDDEIFLRDSKGNITRIMFKFNSTYVFENVASLMYTDRDRDRAIDHVCVAAKPEPEPEPDPDPEHEQEPAIERAHAFPIVLRVPKDSIFPTGIRRDW